MKKYIVIKNVLLQTNMWSIQIIIWSNNYFWNWGIFYTVYGFQQVANIYCCLKKKVKINSNWKYFLYYSILLKHHRCKGRPVSMQQTFFAGCFLVHLFTCCSQLSSPKAFQYYIQAWITVTIFTHKDTTKQMITPA